MKARCYKLAATVIVTISAMYLAYWASQKQEAESFLKPSEILRFMPVCEGSDPNDIRIAQAELCRHGIEVEIDGKVGEKTALAMCELLVKIQNGYKINSIYERNRR